MNTTSDTPISLTTPPEGYADWLGDLKARIHAAQQRATLSVNRKLVLLYWQIGRDILTQQAQQGWGAKLIEWLAHDLRAAFPEMKGFSPRNLKYMRAFSEAWPDSELVQQAAAQLPWFQLCTLLDKLKTRSQVKNEHNNPTIGLLLCKNKNKIVAEYALGDKTQPKGVAEYKLLASLPAQLQTSLPSIEQIEQIERELMGGNTP